MTTGDALRACLISPNESDSNFEAANVVDGLYSIARALSAVATAIQDLRYNLVKSPLADSLRARATQPVGTLVTRTAQEIMDETYEK